jgi:hypothetical protein
MSEHMTLEQLADQYKTDVEKLTAAQKVDRAKARRGDTYALRRVKEREEQIQ